MTPGEKIGLGLAFIPGVSTVAGIVKAINYSKRESEHEQAVNNVAQDVLKNQNRDLASYERKLWIVSIIEIIPGVNIIAALFEWSFLSSLSDIRESNPFFKQFNVKPIDGQAQNNEFVQSLEILDRLNLSSPNKRYFAHALYGWYNGKPNELKPKEALEELIRSTYQGEINRQNTMKDRLDSLEAKKNKKPVYESFKLDGKTVPVKHIFVAPHGIDEQITALEQKISGIEADLRELEEALNDLRHIGEVRNQGTIIERLGVQPIDDATRNEQLSESLKLLDPLDVSPKLKGKIAINIRSHLANVKDPLEPSELVKQILSDELNVTKVALEKAIKEKDKENNSKLQEDFDQLVNARGEIMSKQMDKFLK